MFFKKKEKKEERKWQVPLKNVNFGIDIDYDYENDPKVYCIRCEYYLDAIAGERCTHPKVNATNKTPVGQFIAWGSHLTQNKNNDCKYFKLEKSLCL